MRHRLRVLRAHARAWVGLLRLAVAIARGRVDQVWVGDSHAAYFVADHFPPMVVGSTAERRWVWHLGPRLMFSIARDGFKPEMHRALRMLGRVPHSREVTWVFSFGEIDNRCHLAPRVADGLDLDFVAAYVDRIRGAVTDLGAPSGLVLFPPPPALEDFVHESFPVRGTNEERLVTHRMLRARLADEISAPASGPRLVALDLTDDLSDPQGWFDTALHFDGVHANDAGRALAQARLREVLAQS